ncbi:HU family DNA-binding protein [Pseudoalteromonas sp. OFAV1]|uniref:HU family DNA-binding protein n=1 Tax=Pseudoalteromonas sp. OFAV1 TaxID=2908892 RepID=UPI001F46A13A|nr:HU family DNA-binding protein [Pseudoalteromonas sp. OFAV1]MCF2900896.1 HU family DNA-binding protein [Pseudoalteromonas sp. OFAV1]
MNKSQLIEAISKEAEVSKSVAESCLNAFMSTIESEVKEGNTVSLIGFGTFSLKERAARKGRNPQTGEELHIAAKKLASFKPGSSLTNL